MNKTLLAKSVLALGVLLATMPAAEAQRGFRGGGFGGRIIVGPAFGYGYPGYYGGYGYPGYYGGYYGGFGFNTHPNAGQLKLDTKQKDAQVYIDGAYAGTAKEMKSTWLKQGTYDLELRAPGGERYASQIYIIPGKTIHIRPLLPADSHS
jgi:hypothetical protein